MPLTDTWPFVATVSTLVTLSVAFGLLRLFPKFISDLALRGVEQANAVRLERVKHELARDNAAQLEKLKDDLSAAPSTIKTSAEFLAASQSELRARMIAAVEQLWKFILADNEQFRDLIFLETILLHNEIDDLFKRKDWSKFPTVKTYATPDAGMSKLKLGDPEREQQRLFVGERLWTIFAIHTAVLGRLAHLYSESHRENRYRDWRGDSHFKSMLTGFIPQDVLDTAFARSIGGPGMILQHLEAMFLKEALAIMSGTRTFADTIGEMGSTLLQQKERMAMAALRPGT